MTISKRAELLVNGPAPLVEGQIKYLANPFSEENLEGIVNLGIAENSLMDSELEKFFEGKFQINRHYFHYNRTYGIDLLREGFCKFYQEDFAVENLNPENVVVQPGVSAICENLSFALFDKGDVLIIPAPFYAGFYHDFCKRFEVEINEYPLEDDYSFDAEKFKQHVLEIQKNKNVKALMLTNPNNPTGTVFSKQELQAMIKVCDELDIHLISDEVYAGSVFGDQEFISVYNLDCDRSKVHILYSMAKDFCLGGFKQGFMYTENIDLLKAMQATSYYYTPGTPVQILTNEIFQDKSWRDEFKKSRNERVAINYQFLKVNCKWEIGDLQAGFFSFSDFSKYLKEPTAHAEVELSNTLLEEYKVLMTPGQYFGSQKFGHFRLCFAKGKQELAEFVKRMNTFIKERS